MRTTMVTLAVIAAALLLPPPLVDAQWQPQYGSCPSPEIPTNCANPCNDCRTRGQCNFLVCNAGCNCPDGYHRNASGACVLASLCPGETPTATPTPRRGESECAGANEVRVRCVNVCNDCWSRGRCEQPFCEPGCDCAPGHFRDDWGECVPQDWCPADDLCDVNEEYSSCALSCNTCEQRGDCDDICEPGCDCKAGFYRDRDDRCIPENQCPPYQKACPKGEVVSECAKPSWCNTCALRGNCRLANCSRGCDCAPGHFRHPDHMRCVPEHSCPAQQRCAPDEQFYSCVPDCTGRCAPAACGPCRPGCFCRVGLVRREADGRCVTRAQCPPPLQQGCERPDQEYYGCKPFCHNTCAALAQKEGLFCPQICLPGCFCRKGLLLRDDGQCVAPHLCEVKGGPSTPIYEPGFIFGRGRGIDLDDDNVTASSKVSASPRPPFTSLAADSNASSSSTPASRFSSSSTGTRLSSNTSSPSPRPSLSDESQTRSPMNVSGTFSTAAAGNASSTVSASPVPSANNTLSASNSTSSPLGSSPNSTLSASNSTSSPLGSSPNNTLSASNSTSSPLGSSPSSTLSSSNSTSSPSGSSPKSTLSASNSTSSAAGSSANSTLSASNSTSSPPGSSMNNTLSASNITSSSPGSAPNRTLSASISTSSAPGSPNSTLSASNNTSSTPSKPSSANTRAPIRNAEVSSGISPFRNPSTLVPPQTGRTSGAEGTSSTPTSGASTKAVPSTPKPSPV